MLLVVVGERECDEVVNGANQSRAGCCCLDHSHVCAEGLSCEVK